MALRLCLICWGFVATTSALRASDPQVLAQAGREEVTVEEIRSALETLDARQLAALKQDSRLLEQVVRSFIVQRLVLREALQSGWDERPEVAARLQRARDSALTESYLESHAQPPAHYPDETELAAAYEQRKAVFFIPRSFRLAQLHVPVKSEAGADARGLARQKIIEAQNDTERYTDLGWLTEAQIQPEVRTHLPELKPGSLSQPLALQDGWHIFKILETREPRTPGLDEVRAQLRLTLRNERQSQNAQAWLATFLKEHPLKVDAAALSRTLPSASDPTRAP